MALSSDFLNYIEIASPWSITAHDLSHWVYTITVIIQGQDACFCSWQSLWLLPTLPPLVSCTCIMCLCQFEKNKLLMKHLLCRDPKLICARSERKGEKMLNDHILNRIDSLYDQVYPAGHSWPMSELLCHMIMAEYIPPMLALRITWPFLNE